jgi:hypothetical protein
MAQYRVKNGHHIIGGKNLRVGNTFEVKNPAFPKSEDFDRFFERVLPIDVSPKVNPDAVQGGLPPSVEKIDDVKPEKVEKANKGGRAKRADAALEVE